MHRACGAAPRRKGFQQVTVTWKYKRQRAQVGSKSEGSPLLSPDLLLLQRELIEGGPQHGPVAAGSSRPDQTSGFSCWGESSQV